MKFLEQIEDNATSLLELINSILILPNYRRNVHLW